MSKTGKLVLVIAIVIGITISSAATYLVVDRGRLEIVNGFYLTTVLHNFNPPQHIDFKVTEEPFEEWGIQTNSHWLLDYTLRIVPLMTYDGITKTPIYPNAVGFKPYAGDEAFSVLGYAQPLFRTVFINWRYTEDPTMNDEIDALATLTHELIHVQGGIFDEGTSAEKEAATSAATSEVLASMCNFGDDLACAAFLEEMESNVRSVLISDLSKQNAEWVYQSYSMIFLRDDVHRRIAEKTMRYWAPKMQDRYDIIEKYGVVPLQHYIGPGFRGQKFETGLNTYLTFADAQIAMQRLKGDNIVWLIAQYSETK